VRAATEGRILVLEGLEKAERNVLPVLNNLLENREMQLEDGRFLMSSQRYDKLLQVGGQGSGPGGSPMASCGRSEVRPGGSAASCCYRSEVRPGGSAASWCYRSEVRAGRWVINVDV